MKGPSLIKQFNKMINTNWKDDKQSFRAVEQIYYTSDYPGLDFNYVQVENNYSARHWELDIKNPEKLKECSKIPNKELKCKQCKLCGIYSKNPISYLCCSDIQRLELDY